MRRLIAVLLACTLGALMAPTASAGKKVQRDPRWGGADSPLRPGASLGGYCTFNFAYYTPGTKSRAPRAFIGTAGHCTSEIGEQVESPGFGPVGRVVYDSDLVDSGVDFSLIELDPDVVGQTNPAVLGWGGPKGAIGTDELSIGDRVDVYGYGIGVGTFEQTRPRYGVLVSWTDDEYQADMPAVNGDSGAPLIHHDTGLALGIISRYGIAIPPSTDQGPLIGWILEELAAAGFNVRLATV